MKSLLSILGVLIVIGGFCAGFYIDIYMLIKAIIDIVHGGNIAWDVFMIIIREVVGFLVIVFCWFVGIALLAAAND
jgi:hypothetical protein